MEQAELRAQLEGSIMLQIPELEEAVADADARLMAADAEKAELRAQLEGTVNESASRETALTGILTGHIDVLRASLVSAEAQARDSQARLEAVSQTHYATQVWQCPYLCCI